MDNGSVAILVLSWIDSSSWQQILLQCGRGYVDKHSEVVYSHQFSHDGLQCYQLSDEVLGNVEVTITTSKVK